MAAAATSVLLGADAAAAPKVQARPDFGPVELPSGTTPRLTHNVPSIIPTRTRRRPNRTVKP